MILSKIVILIVSLVVLSCGSGVAFAEGQSPNPVVTMDLGELGTMEIELYPAVAPNTVANFISLVQQGYYDGVIFHRVIPGFMIQGGDPTGTGTGGPGYSIKGEFAQNGFRNDLKHGRGVISMARTSIPDSAGSQFFIMVERAPHLDGAYAAFGQVIKGIEVADKIVNAERNRADRPLQDQTMVKVTVETFGVEYPEPEKL
ncbi:MAG: peptidylprolyl isomerase [Firmicutes bacterium]|nr:peptidylprolyl isomerase [Bacillota bacterium]